MTTLPNFSSPPARRTAATLSCVLPCRNEALNLAGLLPRLVAVLAKTGLRWEIVVVDDGSDDETVTVARRWSNLGVSVVELSRNFGKEAALSAGLDSADGDIVLLMDADGQHEPEWIPQMIDRWTNGADMVCMVRSHRQDESWVKRMGARFFYRFVIRDARSRLLANASDFRLLDRGVVETLRALPERGRLMKGLFAWVGYRVACIEYQPSSRMHGRSHYGLGALVRMSVTGITALSTRPLHLASVLGIALLACSLACGAFIALGGGPASGWAFAVATMLLLSGIQLVALGILGEYLGRVFEETKGRPLYVVRQRHGTGNRLSRASSSCHPPGTFEPLAHR